MDKADSDIWGKALACWQDPFDFLTHTKSGFDDQVGVMHFPSMPMSPRQSRRSRGVDAARYFLPRNTPSTICCLPACTGRA
eukprot:scaffold252546_cov18-Tisochrysis_lutea.AAC.1